MAFGLQVGPCGPAPGGPVPAHHTGCGLRLRLSLLAYGRGRGNAGSGYRSGTAVHVSVPGREGVSGQRTGRPASSAYGRPAGEPGAVRYHLLYGRAVSPPLAAGPPAGAERHPAPGRRTGAGNTGGGRPEIGRAHV